MILLLMLIENSFGKHRVVLIFFPVSLENFELIWIENSTKKPNQQCYI